MLSLHFSKDGILEEVQGSLFTERKLKSHSISIDYNEHIELAEIDTVNKCSLFSIPESATGALKYWQVLGTDVSYYLEQ